MAETWKPCKYQKKNTGLHCEAQSGCEKCGWNPKKTKSVKWVSITAGNFDDKKFSEFLSRMKLTFREVGNGIGIGEANLAQKRRGRVEWKVKDLISLANYFETTPQKILENFFNVPKIGGDTNG